MMGTFPSPPLFHLTRKNAYALHCTDDGGCPGPGLGGYRQAQTGGTCGGLPVTSFHTENLVQFASDVGKATGGKL